MAGVRHSGLSNVTTADTTVSDDLVVTDALTVNGAAAIGNAVGDGLAFYGTTTVSQRASSNQASTLGSTTGSIGTAASVLLMEIANTLTALGLWKGGA